MVKHGNQDWIEIDCKSPEEMYQLLNQHPRLRTAFDAAIKMITELSNIKEEMNVYMKKAGYLSLTNPSLIDTSKQEQILKDKKLSELRSMMHESLIKYGLLVPAGANEEETQQPLNLFGPGGKATVLQGSVSPRRIGMHMMPKQDYNQMMLDQQGFLGRLKYRFKEFYAKWMY